MTDSDQRSKEAPGSAPRDTPSGAASSDPTARPSEIKTDSAKARERLDKALGEHLERYFTEVLDRVYLYSSAAIERIDDRGECLDIVFRMPFFLAAPSPDAGKWLLTARARTKLRKGFMDYLRRGETVKEMSDLLYAQLSHFLLELGGINKYNDKIQAQLRKIAQKMLAGRPSHPIPNKVEKRIQKEGVNIYRAIQDMQNSIKRWKKTDRTIRGNIRRLYPTKKYPWLPIFVSLIPKLPYKPYYPGRTDPSGAFDEKGKPLPAKLSEPDRWSTIDIAVKILQQKLRQEIAIPFSLDDIKRTLSAAVRKSRN